MKKRIALIVLVAMLAVACFGVFAACQSSLEDYVFVALLNQVDGQYIKAQGQTTYTLDSVVKTVDVDDKEITCSVKWEADNGVTITDGNNVVTVTVPAGVTNYILKGTLVDENDKAYDFDGNPVIKSVSAVSGGNQGGNQGGNTGDNTGGNTGGNQGGNTGGNTTVEGSITPSQAMTEAESLNLASGAYSDKSYKVVGYVVSVKTKDLTSGTVYDIDLADTAGGTKAFTLYHGNLSGSGVPAVGDKVLAEGHLTRYDYSDGTHVLQLGGNKTTGFATVEVLEKGNGGTTGGDSGNTGGNQGGNTGGTETPNPDGSTNYVLNIGTYGTEQGLANGAVLSTISLDFATLTASGTGVGEYDPNTGKWYTANNGTWRFYQTESPSLVIAAKSGYTVVSVKITYVSEKTGVLTLNGTNIESGIVTTVTGNTITFSVGNTGTATNGQVRITSIEIVYTAA